MKAQPVQPVVVKQGDGEELPVLGTHVKFVCSADRTAHAWSLIECAAGRDAGPPPHHHAWDEAYYVLAGKVRFSVGEREVVLGAGEFVLIPGGTVHGFQGASDDARMLIFDAPAHSEAFFREASREVQQIPDDLPKVPVIGERHGIHFLPPPAL
jgi:quercetin dioxygenase-like cupin family protein